MMGAPIRIAHVMGKMVGGGVESVVMNYYRHIDRSSIQFDFLIDSDSTLVPIEEIHSLGGRVFEIPPYQKPIAYQRALGDLFKGEDWPIVHSHINSLSVFPLRAAKKAGIPVRIAHSHSTSGSRERAKNLLKYALRTQSNRYPTHRLACSKLAGDWLFGSSVKYEVIPNAIDLNIFSRCRLEREVVRDELGIGRDDLVIGHVGRFAEQKNHGFLLEIFADVLNVRSDAWLMLVGNGELFEEAKNRASELGVAPRTIFLGHRDDIYRLYSAMDVFCLPSLYEGLPVVGVEAQAAEVPLVTSSNVTEEIALTSIVKRISLSCGSEAWAKELIGVVGSRLSKEDSLSLSSFDIKVCANRLEKMYLSLLG